mmetsp:Transcript_31985/g.36943  ORF Transcript_31985/g.36943 Transcript_31985/m.36943 type:complete len:109 (-) Transcript_31985:35-361(-)
MSSALNPKKAAAPIAKKPAATSLTMLDLIGCRISVMLDDDTNVVGKLLSFDHKQNVILKDAERVRTTKSTRRVLRESVGLVYLRGSSVVSVSFKPSITTNRVVVDTRI